MIEIVKAPKDASSQFKVAQVSLEHLLSRKELGFWQLPQRQELWGQCLRLGSLMRGQYESMVLVGIGGSSLGPRVILDVFNIQKVHLLDNVDAIQFERLLRKLGDLSKVLFVFISKSGTTIETLCTLEFLREELATRGLHLDKQSCVITEERAS
ncbi:MAG: hypothetical protein N2578_06595, partial [Bdellovibrionaceae bacterium]|nr:hypothetical protein [Pseudobdellovibrionaceae bacterium]